MLKNNINILIVDDTPEHIKIASSILKKLGYPIRIANNGEKALKLIKELTPTLILLDVELPDMNGFEICNSLQANPLLQDIAVIFVTVSNDEESIRKGFLAGGKDYVIKPYNSSELLARVSTHIKLVSQTLELKASYEELDHFCHTVSHDLKSPILVIKQLANILSSDSSLFLNEDSIDIINRINNKCDDLTLMVESLLELSKMTKIKCTLTSINIESLIREVFKELTSLEPNRIINLNISSLPTVLGDRILLRLLIQNIISNSLKFTKNNKISDIQVDYEEINNFHKISITDNGVGFDMKYSTKLFKIFERLHNKEDFKGTGVGLVTIKRIIEKHGGSVSICSKLNKFTTISFTLPKS